MLYLCQKHIHTIIVGIKFVQVENESTIFNLDLAFPYVEGNFNKNELKDGFANYIYIYINSSVEFLDNFSTLWRIKCRTFDTIPKYPEISQVMLKSII